MVAESLSVWKSVPHFAARRHIQKKCLKYDSCFILCTIQKPNSYVKGIGTKCLTHWGWVMHICVSKLTITGSDNDLSSGRCQAIIWTNAVILWIGPLGTKFCKILIEIHIFSFKKMHLKMLPAKWRSFGLSLNVLISQMSACASNVFEESVYNRNKCIINQYYRIYCIKSSFAIRTILNWLWPCDAIWPQSSGPKLA